MFYINHNIATICFETKDYKNAIKYSESALKVSSNEQTETLLAVSLIKDGQEDIGVKKLTEIFEKNPSNLDVGFTLSQFHLSKMHFVEMLKVLKSMNKNSPEFKKDERRKNYGIWNLFV